MTRIRLHHTQVSRGNGPGVRFTVWTQGCGLACPGCFNEPTHPAGGGFMVDVPDLAKQIMDQPNIDGVTISGGEPLDQADAIFALLEQVSLSSPRLTWVLYTGYTHKEILANPERTRVVAAVDLTLAGRYQRAASHPYLRKRIITSSNRVDPGYFSARRTAEWTISGGMVTMTGIQGPNKKTTETSCRIE